MIPQRIVLEGFLCYRQRQELSFGDSPLWMLAGLNGSGKSAIFDAVTYALFGGHRGGMQHAEQLINKDSDGLLVEFDFRLGDDTYRIKRTLKRSSRSTRQLLRWTPDAAGKERWEAVENTGGARGFEEWIKDHIGLNYETFTSSVLLLQGRADKLLNADHNERRRVLAGIVDLERYEKLHRRVDELRKKHKDRAEELQQKLGLIPEVTEEELTAAEEQIAAAAQRLEQARAAVERWQRLELLAERWAKLQARLAETQQQWERARGLLDQAETIERAGARLRELREVLPPLEVAAEQRQRLEASQRIAAGLEQERADLACRVQELEFAEEQTRQKREQLQQAITRDQQQEQDLAARLQELAGALKQVELFEQQQREVARLEAELAELTIYPEALEQARQECERLTELAQAVRVLAGLHRKREELRDAREQARQLAAEEARLIEEGKALGVRCQEAEAAREKARADRQKAAEHAAEAKARYDDARKEADALDTLAGEKRCRHCGQELTPRHLEEEKVRRNRTRVNAEVIHRTAERASKQAAQVEADADARHGELQRQLKEAREEFQKWRAKREAEEQRVGRCAADCRHLYDDLPAPQRQRVAPAPPEDWLTTVYPTAAEVEDLRRQAEGLEAAKQRLREAMAAQQRWEALAAQREAAVRQLQAQKEALPADADTVRREHHRCHAEDADLKTALKKHRAELKDEEKTLERLGQERERVRQQVAERERKLAEEKVRQQECRAALERARAALPAAWQPHAEVLAPAQLQCWRTEREELEAQGADQRARELELARQTLEPLRQELARCEADLETVPAEARAEPAAVRLRLQDVKRDQERCETDLSTARTKRQKLLDRRGERQQVLDDFLKQDQLFHRYKLLAELLGPRRLQLHLVRRAEAGIIAYANEVLDRLSAGQLYLQLHRGDGEETAEKALELEAFVRSAGDAPVGVPFLSGSQRFRVAVSLALGIGRYASRSHRPIESVIIDEGFGCLDRQGRQVMIQELQNLREHMRCILLVSHQEEFADAFPVGYHFALTDGSTEVTRFQRS